MKEIVKEIAGALDRAIDEKVNLINREYESDVKDYVKKKISKELSDQERICRIVVSALTKVLGKCDTTVKVSSEEFRAIALKSYISVKEECAEEIYKNMLSDSEYCKSIKKRIDSCNCALEFLKKELSQ